jgi:DNA primase
MEWVNHPQYNYNPTAFSKLKTSGDNYMFCCPYHFEHDPDSGILKDYPYLFNCFACGMSASLPQLVAHAMDLPTEVHGEHYIIKNYAIVDKEKRPPLDIDLILDGGKNKDKLVSHLDAELDQYKLKRHPYLYSRGFTERTLQKYEVGYDESTRSMVIPIRTSSGTIRFFKRRFVDRKGFLNETNIYKKDVLFGLWNLKNAPTKITTVFITESETDTISCYQGKLPAVALLGRILFDEQIKELLKAGVKEINLFLDNDSHGVQGCLDAYKKLMKTPIRVNKVIYPGNNYGINTLDSNNIEFKDANDILLAGRMNEIQIIDFIPWMSRLKM